MNLNHDTLKPYPLTNHFWLITDTHFNHTDRMMELCGRPMDYERKLAHAMQQIPHYHTLIHLGDVCIGDDANVHEAYIRPLACKKILVHGNHDRKSNNWYLRHGWDFVCESLTLNLLGKNVLLSHRPQAPSPNWDLNIHGHFHNTTHRVDEYSEFYTDKHIALSVEKTNYKAVQLQKIITNHFQNKYAVPTASDATKR